MAQKTGAATDELPAITKIETTARVGPEERPAVVIWFENDTALRYVWVDGEIQEQTYVNGVVHDSFKLGGERDQLAEYALESISEYVQSYRDDPAACEMDWPHIHEMLQVE